MAKRTAHESDPWRDKNVARRKAYILDCSLRAYPSQKRGRYAIHCSITFAVRSKMPFSIIGYMRYIDGRVALASPQVEAEFEGMRVWDAPEFSLEGEMVAGGLHAVAHTSIPKLEPTLGRVVIALGIKICHPSEVETVIDATFPLHVRRATGPLSATRW